MENKKKITIEAVLNLLKEGKTRKDIAEVYSLKNFELKALFQHPKLKGKKVRQGLSFILIDEEETSEFAAYSPVSTTALNDNHLATEEEVQELIQEVEYEPEAEFNKTQQEEINWTN